MNYASICSGIEAATVAWHPLGWRPQFFSEIAPFPCAVLKHHYPDIPNYGDMTRFKDWPDAKLYLLVAGTPCQWYSVAGLRAGLADPRGNLMLTYLAIAERYRPRWVVWENVPGVLSTNDGRDFGALLGGLGELGYGFAYRILDAQFFGVPQRRRRVFVVAYLGNWRRAAAVLFERESLQGNPAPLRQVREEVTGTLGARVGSGSFGTDFKCTGGVINCPAIIPQAMSRKWSKGTSGPSGNECANLLAMQVAPPLTSNPYADNESREGALVAYRTSSNRGAWETGDRTDALTTGTDKSGIVIAGAFRANDGSGVQPMTVAGNAVRRLMPIECERLQGFPDYYTCIPVGKRGRKVQDGPRYQALGNSMATTCMQWIGKRIQSVDAIRAEAV